MKDLDDYRSTVKFELPSQQWKLNVITLIILTFLQQYSGSKQVAWTFQAGKCPVLKSLF